MQPLIELLNALFAPFSATPSMPLDIRPPAIHREAPRAKGHTPQSRPSIPCVLEPLKPRVVKVGEEHDPFASVGRKCKAPRDAMLHVG